jgi:hypothetical protein
MDRPVGSEHLVVPGQRHGSPLHTLIPLWREVLETAGLPRMTVKALRHSHWTHAVITGIAEEHEQQLLGIEGRPSPTPSTSTATGRLSPRRRRRSRPISGASWAMRSRCGLPGGGGVSGTGSARGRRQVGLRQGCRRGAGWRGRISICLAPPVVRWLSTLDRNYGDVFVGWLYAARRQQSRLSSLSRSAWRSRRVNFHWKGWAAAL